MSYKGEKETDANCINVCIYIKVDSNLTLSAGIRYLYLYKETVVAQTKSKTRTRTIDIVTLSDKLTTWPLWRSKCGETGEPKLRSLHNQSFVRA